MTSEQSRNGEGSLWLPREVFKTQETASADPEVGTCMACSRNKEAGVTAREVEEARVKCGL